MKFGYIIFSFEEEETRVVKTIQSPVLDSWKAVGEPGLGAWQAGPEPGQHGGYGGAGIKKTSWEEGAEWLAQQGNVLLKFYSDQGSKGIN